MKNGIVILGLFALFVIAGANVAVSKSEGRMTVPKIETLHAHLFYEKTGVLSDNVAPPASFNAWNTSIGEGDAKEPANDLIVGVDLDAPKSARVDDLSTSSNARRARFSHFAAPFPPNPRRYHRARNRGANRARIHTA